MSILSNLTMGFSGLSVIVPNIFPNCIIGFSFFWCLAPDGRTPEQIIYRYRSGYKIFMKDPEIIELGMNLHVSLFWVLMFGTMWKYTICKNFFNWNCGRIGLLLFLFSISFSLLFSTTSTLGSGIPFSAFTIFFFILFAFDFYFSITISFG